MTLEERADLIVDAVFRVGASRETLKDFVWFHFRQAVAQEREECVQECARVAELEPDVYNIGNCIAAKIRAEV